MKAARVFTAVLVGLLIITGNVANSVEAKDQEHTIYTYKEDYQGAKHEPQQGTYLGAYVLEDQEIGADMATFNEVMGKEHASYFKYVGYGRPFPTKWVEQVKSVGAVPHIAYEPNRGLSEVEDDKYLRDFAQAAKAADVPIFLRFASEMNGNWTNYSGDSEAYIAKWQLVHDVFAEEAPNVAMVWTVFTFPEHTIKRFYPGDEYVDWVGVNIYNVVYHNNNINAPATHEDPLKLLDYVYNEFSYKKPIQISEYGVTHYSVTDQKYHIDFATSKIKRLYENLPSRYPRVKSIFYFNVNTLNSAFPDRRINNYALTTDEQITNTYQEVIAKRAYLSKVSQSDVKSWQERLTFNGNSFIHKGSLFVDHNYFINYLDLSVVSRTNSRIVLSNGKKQAEFGLVAKNLAKGFYGQYRKISALPLRRVAEFFGYRVYYDGRNKIVQVLK